MFVYSYFDNDDNSNENKIKVFFDYVWNLYVIIGIGVFYGLKN